MEFATERAYLARFALFDIIIVIWNNKDIELFKGVLHLLPQKAPNLACFVLCLTSINIFLKNSTVKVVVFVRVIFRASAIFDILACF